jgi:hypothetical protein
LHFITKFPEVFNERFKRIFSKGLDIGFFKDVSDGLQKCFQSDNRSDPGSKKRRQNIGALFKPEPDKMNK